MGHLGTVSLSSGPGPSPAPSLRRTPSPPSGRAPTPGACRTCTRLLGVGVVSTGELVGAGTWPGPGPLHPCPFPARCPTRLLKVPRDKRTRERVCGENSLGNPPEWGAQDPPGVTAERRPQPRGRALIWSAVPARGPGHLGRGGWRAGARAHLGGRGPCGSRCSSSGAW